MSTHPKILDMLAEGTIASHEAIQLIKEINTSEDYDENTDYENSLKKVRRLLHLFG